MGTTPRPPDNWKSGDWLRTLSERRRPNASKASRPNVSSSSLPASSSDALPRHMCPACVGTGTSDGAHDCRECSGSGNCCPTCRGAGWLVDLKRPFGIGRVENLVPCRDCMRSAGNGHYVRDEEAQEQAIRAYLARRRQAPGGQPA